MAEQISIRLYDAYLRYYMHVQNPESLPDDEWAEQIQDLHHIRTKEKENAER